MRPSGESGDIELASGPLERRRPGPLEAWGDFPLTEQEREARRRNRRWLLGLSIPSIAVLVVALVASGIAQSNEPNGPSISVPAGFQAVRDGYYTYAIPAGWSSDAAGTDSTGDSEMAGGDGWAAQHIGYRTTAPVPGETPPSSMEALGSAEPAPFTLTGGHPVTVPGASTAYTYEMTRAGAPVATVVDAWSIRSGVELWLAVHAPAGVTHAIFRSLTG